MRCSRSSKLLFGVNTGPPTSTLKGSFLSRISLSSPISPLRRTPGVTRLTPAAGGSCCVQLQLRGQHSKETQLPKETILKLIQDSPHQFIKLAASDIDGIPRGKYVAKSKFISAAKKGLGFCSVVFGWDSSDALYDNTKEIGWHMGYADVPATVDLQTFRQIPWEEDLPFFLMDFTDPDNKKNLAVCPRVLLKKVIEDLQKNQLTAKVGPEFEWFNFRETPESIKAKNYINPEPLTPGMFGYSLQRAGQNLEYFQTLMNYGNHFRVPFEGIHTETGPGVYEVAIEYDDALEAADRAFLFKMMTKQVGHTFGIIPSFMAKPHANLPGCGAHLHVTFHDPKTGSDLFYDPNDPNTMSEMCRRYIAGVLYCMPHVMPMYAPTINSYKRLVEGYWAPTTPTWGIENRTVSVRLIPGKKPRVEVRIPGADTNAYLAISACLASGLYGVQHKLKVPEPIIGNGYTQVDRSKLLPRNLWEATQEMKKSKIAKELFGESFVDHFVATREWEWRQFQKAITNWEIERYFEII